METIQQPKIRTYSELIKIPTFIERYRYLRLRGHVGEDTFGWDRYLNQLFYHSREWKDLRNEIIIRDNGCDLAVEGYEIGYKIYIHHMNPIYTKDILEITDLLLDPEYLVCVSFQTHQAIHFGDENMLITEPVVREPNDTTLW